MKNFKECSRRSLKKALAKFEEENDYPDAFLDARRSKQ